MARERQRRRHAGRGGAGSRSPTRACCAATAASRSCASTAAARSPSRTTSPGSAHTCAGLRLEADLDALRAEALAVVQRAGVAPAPRRHARRAPHRDRRAAAGAPAGARVATVTYAPTRVLNGLKTLSYAANMLAGRLAKEQGADEALLVTPHGRVLEGPTWTFFWVARRAAAHAAALRRDPRLDHAPAAARGARRHRGAVHARRRARGRGGVHRLIGARGDADRGRRRHRAAARARTRSPTAAHAAFRQRVARELASEAAAA